MGVRSVLKFALAMATVVVFSSGAEARGAYWSSAYWGRVDAFVYDDADKKEVKVQGKVEGVFFMDTTDTAYADVQWEGDDFSLRLTGTYLSDSDRKSKVTDELDDADDMDQLYPAMFLRLSFKGKKPKVEPVEIDFGTVENKGKVAVNKKFQKIKLMNTATFEGTVGGDGPYAGQAIRGKIKLKIKGDRNDG